jgi:aspartate 1-decarboxylase
MGSITLSAEMLKASGIKEFEKVQVVNINNGARIETYTIATQKEGVVCLNGAAARFFEKGDLVIIMSYTWIQDGDEFSPRVVFVDEHNAIVSHGFYQAGGDIG